MDTEDLIFISYAREDQAWAERLYMDLRKLELNVWLDIRCLKAGSTWGLEIPRAIRQARYFLLLVSNNSVNKRGYIQKEIKEALDVRDELPRSSTFILPVRLDDTQPLDPELHELNWTTLLPNYHDGLARILSEFANLKRMPLKHPNGTSPSAPIEVVDKGKTVLIDLPMILGERASVSYAPFRSRRDFLQQFFDRLPTEHMYGDTAISYYITIDTQHPHVQLGEDLLARYPQTIVIVLQHVYEQLVVRESGFTVRLSFGGTNRDIGVPWDSIRLIEIRELGIRMLFEAI